MKKVVMLMCVLMTGVASATVVFEEDFDSLTEGTLDGQNGWVKTGTTNFATVLDDGSGTNNILQMGEDDGNKYSVDKTIDLTGQATATMSFDVKATVTTIGLNEPQTGIGLASGSTINSWSNYNCYILVHGQDDGTLNFGNYDPVTASSYYFGTFSWNQWYTVDIVADLENATYQVFFDGSLATGTSSTGGTLNTFGFRNTNAVNRVSIFSTQNQDTSSVFIDNIVVDAVVPEPATLLIMGLGGLLVNFRRKR